MKLIDDFLVNKTVSVIPRELNQSNIFKFNDLKFMYINPPMKRGKMISSDVNLQHKEIASKNKRKKCGRKKQKAK